MNVCGRTPFMFLAWVIVSASASGQSTAEPGGPPSQQADASPRAVSQAQGVSSAATNTPSTAVADGPARQGKSAASPGNKDLKGAASNAGRKVLVDDTINDAQLRQILAKGYEPQAQARGNQVYYCRSDHELGSRFATKTCKTAQRILQDELQGKEATAGFQQKNADQMIK